MEPVNLEAECTTLIVGVSADLIDVAIELGARGERFALLSRNPDELESLAERLSKRGVDTRTLICDVTDSDSVLAAFKQLTTWTRRLDRLIYNVGVITNESAVEVTSSGLARVMGVNFYGFVNCMQLARPMMKQTGGGHALIISGSSALDPEQLPVAYATSKASLQIYIKALRDEVEAEGIRLTELHLGRKRAGEEWRWLTCEEIVTGVLQAIETAPNRLVIGTR